MKPTTVLITEMTIGRRELTLPKPIKIKHPEETLLILVVRKDGSTHQRVIVDLESVIKGLGE